LSVLAALRGRSLLMTGATGFIGKVTLALLLERQPEIGRVYVLVRQRPGLRPEERFFDSVLGSPAFSSLRDAHGAGFDAFVRARVEVVCGDVTSAGLGLSETDLARLNGRVDALLNVAGLVSLNPGLAESLEINAQGALNAAHLAARLNAGLVHMSTCYVAGVRSGRVGEGEEFVGYAPRRAATGAFSAAAEFSSCEDFVSALASRARAKASVFEEQARERLLEKSRPVTPRAVEAGAGRQAKRWIEEQLIIEGRLRAQKWGWPNVYCYTKAMGEQLVSQVPGLRYTILRPSIVESALRYPFPGWNEGLTTSAPVILAMCTGHALWPAHPTAAIDVIPVDLVASSTLMATAALLAGRHARVYHQSSSDDNPLSVRRCMRFVGEYRRDHYKDHAPDALWAQWLWTRMGVFTVSKDTYSRFGVPAFRRAISAMGRLSAAVRPSRRTPQSLARMERDLGQVEHVVNTFMPFIHDVDCVFEAGNLRELRASMPERERRLFSWDPERIDWRDYWFDVHTAGLRRWVFPGFPGRNGGPLRPSNRPVANQLVREALSLAHRFAYGTMLRVTVSGAEQVPNAGGFIVAANHASHLDMGLVKHALGHAGRDMVALAAKDYFFGNPALGWFFRNFTNLLPIGRFSAVKDALGLASRALRRGNPLLIFPEATRSTTGHIRPFKSAVGYLAIHNKVDVLPVYLDGTHRALPKGAALPRSRSLTARIGPVLSYTELHRRTRELPRKEAYRAATAIIEAAVKELQASWAEPNSLARSRPG